MADQELVVACTREKHDIKVVKDVYREVFLRLCVSSTGRDYGYTEGSKAISYHSHKGSIESS